MTGAIRSVHPDDAGVIAELYNYYIEKTIITFEETPIATSEMRTRILKVTDRFPWRVYIEHDDILGYAYMEEFKSRCSYRNTAEVSIYLKLQAQCKGIGSLLMADLLEQAKPLSIHALIGGIALPNLVSVRLHEKFGFQKVGHLKEVGFKFDQWIDVGYWEKIL